MSFNINGPSNIPSIQEAQSMMNNGGGGNLGYFMREESDEAIKFNNNNEEDSFEKSSDLSEEAPEFSFDLFDKIKRFFRKLSITSSRLLIKNKKGKIKDEFVKNS